ncbi:hypothetical protein D3C76_560170 [compost metagenome]
MARRLFLENNRLALLAKVLLPLHAQLGGDVMDENRHVALQADECVARTARQHFEAILRTPVVPQRLVGIARQKGLFEGVEHKACIGAEGAEVSFTIVVGKGCYQVPGSL